jgi:radical SAM-linked protein
MPGGKITSENKSTRSCVKNQSIFLSTKTMRIRISFSKSEAMRYIGHLDLFRAWERTFRRSTLPLAYSQGFHPQPRLNLACALPLGFTSGCEIIDAWLEHTLPLPQILQAIEPVLPPGMVIQGVEEIDLQAPALQTQVTSANYVITFLDPIPDLAERMKHILSAENLPRRRRDKPYDLRPLIEDLVLIPSDEAGLNRIQVQLASREAATGRPEELLEEMGIKYEDTRVHREKLIFL